MRTTFLQSGFLVLALVFSGIFADVNAQDNDNERRFSLSLSGGVTFASQSAGGRIDGGFDVASKTNPAFGLGLQYTITKYWSLEGAAFYHKFENKNDNDPNYENEVVSVSFRNIIHLNQLLGTNAIWQNVTPYAVVGAGFILQDKDISRTNPVAVIGVGTGFKITNGANLFLQYDYNVTGNLDSSTRLVGKGSDHYGFAHAGLRFHFGQSGSTPRSWRKAPFELTESDYNTLMALNSRVDGIERQVNSQGSDISTLRGRVDGLDSRVSANEAKIADLESKYADLYAKVRDMETKAPKPVDDGLTQTLADGYYVQVYAANNLERAQRVRAHVRTLTDSPVLITKRHNIYEVRIGVYERFPAAANTLRAVTGTYSDAFVVKFPRPNHLRDAYRGIEAVN